MNHAAEASLLNFAVRMVVPMRREFGSTLDVQQFMRDSDYARSVVEQARTSREERLRSYAETAERLLQGVAREPARPVPVPVPAPVRAEPDFATLRAEAARALIDRAGPLAESLAIRIERAADRQALGPLLVLSEQMIANLRGSPAAADFAARFPPSASHPA